MFNYKFIKGIIYTECSTLVIQRNTEPGIVYIGKWDWYIIFNILSVKANVNLGKTSFKFFTKTSWISNEERGRWGATFLTNDAKLLHFITRNDDKYPSRAYFFLSFNFMILLLESLIKDSRLAVASYKLLSPGNNQYQNFLKMKTSTTA